MPEPNHFGRIEAIFLEAVGRPPGERDALVRQLCGDDGDLYQEVVSLLAAETAAAVTGIEHVGEQMAASWAADAALLVGKRIGRYEIVARLGSGGMGEVYRATDVVLGRDVALKLLTPAFDDTEFRRRLTREARASSALNHPNIATVYEIGRAGGFDFVAAELVEGQTLRTRLAAGPLPVRDIVAIGRQVAAALAAAHAAGVVHRDIKPDNVMVRPDGIVKIVDFGVAKSALSANHTLGGVTTHTGTVTGTMRYMSPEQALGEPVDHRSDIFAVGILLYEMATGAQPFRGPTDAAIYEALLHRNPAPPITLRPDLPPALDSIVARALEKDPALRYQSAADLAADLQRVEQRDASLSAKPVRARSAGPFDWRKVTAMTGTLLAAIMLGRLTVDRAPIRIEPAAAQFTIAPRANTAFTLTDALVPMIDVSVSPDGRTVLYTANEAGGRPKLWIRSVESVEAVPLDGTEGATYPFWSPDGRSVGFFADAALKRIEIGTPGTARILAQPVDGRGGSWNAAGVIVFGSGDGPLYRVPAAGGTPSPVSTLDSLHAELWHRFPQFLPDGDHFLYLARAGGSRSVFVGSLTTPLKKHLLDTSVRAAFARPGYLFFVHDGALNARPFDTDRLELTGEPTVIASPVATSSAFDASFATSDTGVLVYSGPAAPPTQLTWFDRAGRRLGTVGKPATYLSVRLSPDGLVAAVARSDSTTNTPDVWLLDLASGVMARLTFDPWLDIAPIWSPDGQIVAFSSNRGGRYSLFQRAARGGPDEALLFASNDAAYANDWSADGQYIVYTTENARHAFQLHALRLRDMQAAPIDASGFNAYQGRISPDRRWLAYTSEKSGRPEVWIRPFPGPGAGLQVSATGGSEPSWRADGKELFYVAPDGMLMSVELVSGSLHAARPRPLFRTPIRSDRSRTATSYAASLEGDRFLLAIPDEAPLPTVTVALNWTKAVRR